MKKTIPSPLSFRRVLLCLSAAALLAVLAAAQSPAALDRVQQAAVLIRQGQLAAAEAELNVVLRRAPREANALNLLGVVRAQQHRTVEAEQLFLRAIETNRTLLGAYLNLGRLYLELEKADRALWAFAEAEKLAPDNPDIKFNLASLAVERKDYAQALEYLDTIPAAQRDADQLFLSLKSYLGLGRTREAESLVSPLKEPGRVPAEMAATFAALFLEHKLFDDAIEILEAARKGGQPSFALLYNLGAAYFQKNDRRRAEESYLAALSLEPESVAALRALASLARADGDLEKALSYLVRARRIEPASPAVLYDFGWTALNLNLLYDALTVLERLHQMRPDEADYLYPLAIARLNNGEGPRAQELINRFIQLRPQDGRGYFVLGAILYGAKKFTEAREALQRSLSLIYYPDTEYYLGMIAHSEGDEAQAINWLQRTLKSDPANAAAHSALGIIYVKQKEYGAARAELERAIELDPKDQTAHYQLGIVYARLGEKERSQAMFAFSEKLRAEQKEQQAVGLRLIDPPK